MTKNDLPPPETLKSVLEACFCTNLRKLSRIITKTYDEFLQPSGLQTTQFILLGSIGAQPSIAVTPLAETLGMDPTTLARNLKPLERDGLIEVVKGTDRRTRVVKLTSEGTERLMQAFPYWEQAHMWLTKHLGERQSQAMRNDWSLLMALLRR